jgi:hypothetical protein
MILFAPKPRRGLLRLALDPASRRHQLTLETRQGIFEHGLQQRRLWAPGVEAGGRAEELDREHAHSGQALMPGIAVSRHGPHGLCLDRLR